MVPNYPLISCLCITKDKPNLLKRSISCFNYQTYPNKELVIVYENNDLRSKEIINLMKNNIKNIKCFEIDNKNYRMTLGELRNFAVQKASGVYICQWDDDDWYHIGRLEYQYQVIKQSNFPGSIMTHWLVFDTTSGKAYISNQRLWEGSILCKKEALLQYKYENKRFGEDTLVVESLFSMKKLYPINDMPNLYIYVYHGKNTWDYDHWNLIFKYSEELSLATSLLIQKVLNEGDNNTEASMLIDKIMNNPVFEYED